MTGMSRGGTDKVKGETENRGQMKERMYTSPGHKDWHSQGIDDVKCDKMKGPKGVH